MTQERRRQASEGYDYYIVRMQRVWRPPTDVYETEDAIIVKVEIPGMNEDDFDISIAEGRLVIGGTRSDLSRKLGYHNMEIQYGAFRTEVRVRWSLEEDAIQASYENGFLYVHLFKSKPHNVQISQAGH